MEPSLPRKQDTISRLCPACGLCCNGVLFADVELKSRAEAKRLADFGLALDLKGRKPKLLQPCACYDGKRCQIYAERPAPCRAFECRLLQRVQSGQVPVEAALKTIQQARRSADAVRRLVRRLGQSNEDWPLSRRYSQVIAQPMDLAGDASAVELRGELLLAVHELVQILERDFLTG